MRRLEGLDLRLLELAVGRERQTLNTDSPLGAQFKESEGKALGTHIRKQAAPLEMGRQGSYAHQPSPLLCSSEFEGRKFHAILSHGISKDYKSLSLLLKYGVCTLPSKEK